MKTGKDKFDLHDDFQKTWTEGEAIRWASNNKIPPKEFLEDWYTLGLITYNELEVSKNASREEMMKAIASYQNARANMTEEQKAEEAFERRAAFGEGVEVINVFTGERFVS